MNINLLADLLQDVLVDTPPVPEAELSEDWTEFEHTLGKFKDDYIKHLREYRQASHTLTKMKNDLKILDNLTKIITTRDIRQQVITWAEEYRSHPDFERYQERICALGGKDRKSTRLNSSHTVI